jgi:hypothetical protein
MSAAGYVVGSVAMSDAEMLPLVQIADWIGADTFVPIKDRPVEMPLDVYAGYVRKYGSKGGSWYELYQIPIGLDVRDGHDGNVMLCRRVGRFARRQALALVA